MLSNRYSVLYHPCSDAVHCVYLHPAPTSPLSPPQPTHRTFYTRPPPPQTWSAQDLQNSTTRLSRLRLGPHKTRSSTYSAPLPPIRLYLSFPSKQKLITPSPVQLYVWAKIAQNVDMMKRPGFLDYVVLSLTLFLLPPLSYKDVY